MKTEDARLEGFSAKDGIQRVVLGERVRLTRADCIELIDWIWSLEDELLTVREQLAAGNYGEKLTCPPSGGAC